MIPTLKQTFTDLYREKILYNVLFLSLFMIFVGYLASLLVFGHQDRVMLHFGTTVVSVAMMVVAMTVGSRLLRTEIEQRAIYLPLSRPISRASYFTGRATGTACFLFTNLFFLLLVLIGAIYQAGGPLKVALWQWMVLTWVESLMVMGLSLALSFGLRPGINVMVVLAFLFLSHNHDQVDIIEKQTQEHSSFFSALKHLTPDGSVFFLDTRIYYEQPVDFTDLLKRLSYGFMWTLAFLLLANSLFKRRNL